MAPSLDNYDDQRELSATLILNNFSRYGTREKCYDLLGVSPLLKESKWLVEMTFATKYHFRAGDATAGVWTDAICDENIINSDP